jgi:hypothetical protein
MVPSNPACLLLWAPALLIACSGGSGGAGTGTRKVSNEIIYSKHRDPATGLIVPVLAESGTAFDAIEVDSPAIVYDTDRPAAKFLLYYEATNAAGQSTIGLISSNEEDFVPVVRPRTQIIGLGPVNGPFESGATDPTVLVDTRAAEVSRRYKMWFEGRSGVGGATSTIVYCTSADGVTWTGFTACALVASFARVRISDPTVIFDGGLFKMWFEAVDTATGGTTIGYAVSGDGITWTVRDASGNAGAAAIPLLTPGAGGSFDAFSIGAPCVVRDDSIAAGVVGRFKLWYEAGDNVADVQNTIGYMTSADGLMWNRATLPALVPSSDLVTPLPFDSGDLEHPSATIITTIPANQEGRFLLFYTGDGENNVTPNRVGLAKGRL